MTQHDTEAIALRDEERELVVLELDALLPALRGERRARYEQLREATAAGSVPAELARPLESLLELTLQTARARQLYRAEGERILTDLFRRTPGGRELARHLGDVNTALRSLAGHRLESATVRMRTLGHFTVTISTDAATITLAIRPEGVNVDSVSVGGSGG
ncbi:MAG TPA: hypothetical protein VHF25_12770 [Nitriliruptorales bacterium]|nr:hypothetical protein [Nitriliruptorales bacterium]